jgi:diguanylate cyclase (GGDEF)-like protein/PAS domain S-box-containing protein
MRGAYDLWLVACSYLVAVAASYAALELAGRIVVSHGRAVWAWVAGGSIALGLGIWSMHFIGMLAFHLPIPLAYGVPITLLSVVPAILSAALVLALVRGGRLTGVRLAKGAILLGIGIAAMHYTGMAAIPIEPVVRYEPVIFTVSVAVAIVVAYVALNLAFSLSGTVARWKKFAAALVMAGGICAMHYTGMAAAVFAPDSICTVAPGAIQHGWLAGIIAFNTVIVLLVTVAIAFYDARLSDQNARTAQTLKSVNEELLVRTHRAEQAELELRESGERFRSLTDLSSDWYWEQDEDLRFTRMSGGVLKKLGWDPDSFIGRSRWDFPIMVADEALAAHKVLLAAHQSYHDFVYARRKPAGGLTYISSSGIPLFDDKGKFRGYRGVGRDVTEQKLAEETLKAEERRLRLMAEHLPAGAAFINGESLYLNPRVEKITGYEPAELPTLDRWFATLYPGDSGAARRLYQADKAAGFPAPRVVPITRRDGTQRLLEFAAYGDSAGEMWLINDVTERVRAEEKFRVLFEHSSDAHLLSDETGVIDCNNAALEMIGCTDKGQIVGRHPAVLSPKYQPDGRLSAEKAVEMDASAKQHDHHRFEWIHRRLDSTEFPVEVTLTPVELDGRPVMLAVWHDLTERKQREAEIMRAREQLRLALVGSKLALFEWDVGSGEIFLDERWAEMVGSLPGPTRISSDALLQTVHPQDLEKVRLLVSNAIKGLTAFYEAEHRVRTAAGDYIWVQSHGKVVERDAAGKALRISGTNADITRRKQADVELNEAHENLASGVKALEQRNREMALLAELSNFLISCVTVEEACNAIPKYCETLFPGKHGALYLFRASRDHLNPYAAWGDPPDEVVPIKPEDCWALRRGRPHTVLDPQKDSICGHIATRHKGEPYVCVPLAVQGDLQGLTWIALAKHGASGGEPSDRMISKQQLAITLSEQIALALSNIRLRENLRQQTIRDALTGLYNRRFLEESLNREMARCKRNGTGFGVLMMDLDHFKRFNDTFGHDAGDSVLREFAQALQENTREGDIACRFGGEEFVVVLPDTDRDGAAMRGERILAVVRDLHVAHNDKPLGSITISIGLAMYPQNGESVKAIVQSADQALYQAKGAGRDRLVMAELQTRFGSSKEPGGPTTAG